MNNVVTHASCQSPNEINTLRFVSDDELLFRTRELARHETELTIVTIQHLDEIERRELYDKRGYPSLFEYAVRELHYSKGCAWRRIMVMRLCRAVPGIADKLRSGELNLTTASQLQNAIEKRARKAARNAARNAAREPASESVNVPAAGAVSARAEESVSGEVQPVQPGVAGGAAVGAASSSAGWAAIGEAGTLAVAGESAAGESAAAVPRTAGAAAATGAAAAALSAAWVSVGVATTEPAAGESAAAVPLLAAAAATGAAAPALLAPAQAGTAAAPPSAPVPAEQGASPDETEAARVAGKAAVATPEAPAPAAVSPPPGAARECAAVPPAAEPPPAWTLDQKVELVDLVANKSARETEKLLAELEPEVGLPRERQRALGGGRYELRVILDQGSVDTIAKLKGWLSHVNPGFTTGQLLAYLLQQAERKYDPMRERGRAKRGVAAPARHAETCEQDLGVNDERQATGSALGVAVSKADSSTAAAGPTVALGSGSAPNRGAQRVAAPGSEQDRRDITGSAQNQQPPRAGNVRSRTDTEPLRGVRAPLPEDGTAAPAPAAEASRERRARRHIPVAVRRAVWRRYGGACCYEDPLTGVTCGSTHLVQIDHIVPVAQGGSDDISNLRLRCSVHNRRRDPRCASYCSAPAGTRGRPRRALPGRTRTSPAPPPAPNSPKSGAASTATTAFRSRTTPPATARRC